MVTITDSDIGSWVIGSQSATTCTPVTTTIWWEMMWEGGKEIDEDDELA